MSLKAALAVASNNILAQRARVLLQTGLDIHDNRTSTLIYICNILLVQPESDKSKCYEYVFFESLARKLK